MAGAWSAERCCEVWMWSQKHMRMLHQHQPDQPMDAAAHLHPLVTRVPFQRCLWPLYRRS